MEMLDIYTIENGIEKIAIHDVREALHLHCLAIVHSYSQAYVRIAFLTEVCRSHERASAMSVGQITRHLVSILLSYFSAQNDDGDQLVQNH
jgi:hypothetical protein